MRETVVDVVVRSCRALLVPGGGLGPLQLPGYAFHERARAEKENQLGDNEPIRYI